MGRLSDHTTRPRDPEEGRQEEQLFEARIDNTPKNAADDVYVTIQSFDEGKHRFGPVIWRPVEVKGVEVLPEKGAFCLIAKPSIPGHVWLIAWS